MHYSIGKLIKYKQHKFMFSNNSIFTCPLYLTFYMKKQLKQGWVIFSIIVNLYVYTDQQSCNVCVLILWLTLTITKNKRTTAAAHMCIIICITCIWIWIQGKRSVAWRVVQGYGAWRKCGVLHRISIISYMNGNWPY